MLKSKSMFLASVSLALLLGAGSSCHGQFGDSQYPEWHDTGFSELWPNWEDDGHFWTHSSSWPPNHMASISVAWGPRTNPQIGDHRVNISRHEQWPPNHEKGVSQSWQTESEATWPSWVHRLLGSNESIRNYHGTAMSEMWQDHPNHLINVSTTWPGNHDRSISRNWPANHNVTKSLQTVPTGPDDHQAIFSAGYATVPAHLAAVSVYWPPNHLRSVSQSLGGGQHNRAMSASYPPNHHHTTSATWPNHGGTWPANHSTAHSSDWGNPSDPGWPVFPSNHSWLTTANELAGLIPSGGGSSGGGSSGGGSSGGGSSGGGL